MTSKKAFSATQLTEPLSRLFFIVNYCIDIFFPCLSAKPHCGQATLNAIIFDSGNNKEPIFSLSLIIFPITCDIFRVRYIYQFLWYKNDFFDTEYY
ncbi:hypothetical protein RCL_jg21644.t1 [Rhizophagus clarus]|uniref:Uncharacterized protein n=1 Tax=Rhizophagus clarus TaxID=94130 RepID=A0A8H3QH24_9GLOM|nr:hypothetical protein RCL_jg21644.t1 [Rhizophagus clarus]